MSNLVIGIEGLVGAGKTSICRRLINKMPNTVLVNGGNIYRTIVYAMMENGSKLEELKKHRELLRSRRKKDKVITVSLVGYTNAGKSTLLNSLTDANVFAEDKLFATLDPTSRGLELEDARKVLLVDTVGFISHGLKPTERGTGMAF